MSRGVAINLKQKSAKLTEHNTRTWRDCFLKEKGWQVFRFKFGSNPTKIQLIELAKTYKLI